MVTEVHDRAVINREAVLRALHEVKDPEIPTISVVDLGIITKIDVNEAEESVHVTMTPTFVGCPALDVMKRNVEDALRGLEPREFIVTVDFSVPWSSNLVSESGRSALHNHGLALPPRFQGEFDPEISLNAECPFCASTNTRLQSPFGPTLCRALYTCRNCGQGFEQFKPA